MWSSAEGIVRRTFEKASTARARPFRSTSDPWYITTKGCAAAPDEPGVVRSRGKKIVSSGEFITTVIFSAGQLRAEKIFAHARFTVITESANPRLHLSTSFSKPTLPALDLRLKIVC